MNFGALPERLAHVRAEIARRQATAGRTEPVTIVAVTKGFGLDAVEAALAAGLADLGENRVQEALPKIDEIGPANVDWHLIGHLQTNKVKFIEGRFRMVQSLDSVGLAQALVDDPVEQLVRDQPALLHQRARHPPEGGPGGDGLAQHVPRRDLGDPQMAGQTPGLGALARPGRAQEDDAQSHRRLRPWPSVGHGSFSPCPVR